MSQPSSKYDKDQTRKRLLFIRKNQNTKQQHDKSLLITKNIVTSDVFREAKHIAFYHAVRGEADPSALATPIKANSKQFYLPLLSNNKDQGLVFAPINKDTHYKNNQFSIPEPISNKEDLINADDLDLVIMPLLGFDQYGSRLGMGSGYYDRCFSFKKKKTKKPLLFGFAFDFQEIPAIHNEPWDIPLDRLATESRVLMF